MRDCGRVQAYREFRVSRSALRMNLFSCLRDQCCFSGVTMMSALLLVTLVAVLEKFILFWGNKGSCCRSWQHSYHYSVFLFLFAATVAHRSSC